MDQPGDMLNKYVLPAVAAALVFAGGCGKKPDASPSARNQLIIRFFQSLNRGDHNAAAEQAAKLKALDPGNEYLARVIDLQKANQIVKTAQDLLDAGQAREAAQVLEQGTRQMPLEDHLDDALAELQKAMEIEKAFLAYTRTTNLETRRKALEKLEGLAAGLNNEKLTAAVKVQREIYSRQLAEELARLKAAEESAKAAAPSPAPPVAPATATEPAR